VCQRERERERERDNENENERENEKGVVHLMAVTLFEFLYQNFE
jgi:hypothetical protein